MTPGEFVIVGGVVLTWLLAGWFCLSELTQSKPFRCSAKRSPKSPREISSTDLVRLTRKQSEKG